MDELFVTSDDGTSLHLVRAGAGESIVLVHGTMGSKEDWFVVMPSLLADFEVTAFDRRGRGRSGDGPEYAIEREIQDVLAVIDASNPPVHLIGHSFGAVLALLVAARASERVDTLVVYEPPVGEVTPAGDELLDDLDTALATGDLDTAVRTFAAMANITGVELQSHRSNDRVWARLQDAVRSAGREIRAAKAVLPLDNHILGSIPASTLVLLGSEQEDATYSSVSQLAEQLSCGRLGRVPGHHLALVFEPDAFARTIRSFLAGTA